MLVDDYHDIHQVRNPTDQNLSNVAHMATTMINTSSIPPIPFSSTLNEPIHNPLNIDVDLLIWTLQFDYFTCLEVSYTENKTSWFCVSNNTNLNEDELISSLTVHSYEPEFQEVHPEKKQMDFVKLVDFVSQELKSLDDYLQVITPFIELPIMNNYLSNYVIPVPADYPGQYFIRKAITLKRRYGDSASTISNKVLHLVPLLGPLHVSLNTRETLVKIYHPFFNLLYREIFQKRKNLPIKPQPWLINIVLYLAYSGWMIIRKYVLEKFKLSKNIEYQIFLDLLDNAVLFREGHFEQYIETIFRLWTFMKRFERKNYDKIMIAFLSDIFYWQSIDHPIYNIFQDHLTEFNEYFVENFHSLIRRSTVRKQFNPEGLRSDAINVDNNRHNAEFIKPFVSGKKYPYTKKKIDAMVKKSALFLLDFFQKIWENSNNINAPTGKKKLYSLATFNMEITMKALPSGYHTTNPPKHKVFCDYESCNNNEKEINDCVLICGHAYHYECFQKLDFKCKYCLQYFINGIQVLGNSYNKRLDNIKNT